MQLAYVIFFSSAQVIFFNLLIMFFFAVHKIFSEFELELGKE